MLVRILELIALVAIATFAFQLLRPHPLRRLPIRWRLLGLQSPQMARALQLRRSMVRLLLQGRAQDAVGMMADFDRVLSSMAAAIEARSAVASLPVAARGDHADQTQRSIDEAMGWLEAAHGHLVDIARAEIDAAVGEVRARLLDHTESLRLELEARREVESMLAKGEGREPASTASPLPPRHDETDIN